MSVPPPADADYPYAPGRGDPRDPAAVAYGQMERRGRWLHWLMRAAITAVIPLLLFLLITGTITYRAAHQAWAISFLEDRGCSISYWHQAPTSRDFLPAFVREALSDPWWGEVREVSIHDGGVWGGMWYRELDEHDLRTMSSLCGGFRNLQSFCVSSIFFSCQSVAHWPSLKRLANLEIESSKISDSDLAVIGEMTSLNSLKLDAATISDQGLSYLGQLPSLERLTLHHISVSALSSSNSLGFKSLKSLVIGGSPGFDDDAIACFGSPPNLEEINFIQVPIGDRGLDQLMRSRKVGSLIIDRGRLTDASFEILANYPAPRWLVLSGMPLTDVGLVALSGKQFPVLILDHTAMTDEAFRTLDEIKGLETISLADTKVTGTGVQWLSPNKLLDHLDVGGSSLTLAGIQAIAKVRCKQLWLNRANFGDAELALFVNSDDLKYLNIAGTQVTESGVAAFFKTRHQRLREKGLDDDLVVMRDEELGDGETYSSVMEKVRALTSAASNPDSP